MGELTKEVLDEGARLVEKYRAVLDGVARSDEGFEELEEWVYDNAETLIAAARENEQLRRAISAGVEAVSGADVGGSCDEALDDALDKVLGKPWR